MCVCVCVIVSQLVNVYVCVYRTRDRRDVLDGLIVIRMFLH